MVDKGGVMGETVRGMSKWEEKRLGDVVDIISGGTPKTDVREYWDGDIFWLSVRDFAGDGRKVYKAEKTITELGLNKSATKILNKGDIIISARGTVGEIAQLGVPMAFNQSCYGLRAKKNYNNDFIYYSLKHYMKLLKAVSNGAVFDTIIIDTFYRIKMAFPPVRDQQKLAGILSTYDDLIENNNRRIELLEKAAQDLYKEWFVRFRFPEYKNAKFENGLPHGWKVVKLGDEIDITSSKRVYLSDYIESGIPFYRSKEVIQLANGQAITESLYISQEKYNEFKSKFGTPQENDILITSVGTIGVSMLVDNSTFYFKDGNLTWLRSNSMPEFALYLYLWLNSNSGKQQILSSTIGTSQSALTIENLKKNKVLKPSDEILDAFYKMTKPINLEKRNLQTQNQNLIKQRDLLLPRLMIGKLEV